MGRLKAAILREYEDDPDYHIQVHNPRITQAVELYFRGEKMAKVCFNGDCMNKEKTKYVIKIFCKCCIEEIELLIIILPFFRKFWKSLNAVLCTS